MEKIIDTDGNVGFKSGKHIGHCFSFLLKSNIIPCFCDNQPNNPSPNPSNYLT